MRFWRRLQRIGDGDGSRGKAHPEAKEGTAHREAVDKWLRTSGVVVLSNDEGHDWVSGRIRFHDYLEHAVRDAEAEARDDVEQMVTRRTRKISLS